MDGSRQSYEAEQQGSHCSALQREAALAHKAPGAVQAAYRRTTYLGTPDNPGARVKLMAAWGRYCASGAAGAGNVVPLPGKKAG